VPHATGQQTTILKKSARTTRALSALYDGATVKEGQETDRPRYNPALCQIVRGRSSLREPSLNFGPHQLRDARALCPLYQQGAGHLCRINHLALSGLAFGKSADSVRDEATQLI
jgi:hypothetical protein